MFLPTTKNELDKLNWSACDVILITGDTYIDSPFNGAAVIGRWLTKHGFKVGLIAQPDVKTADIARLGEPLLFWGVTAGSFDSMVANYTASGKWRKSDDLTPGNVNNRRPNRASTVYTNLIRRYFKQTKPIILGGVEASMRRVVHYDFWTNKLRKSILFNAKADFLAYGMAEKTILQAARNLQAGKSLKKIPGLCYIAKEPVEEYLELPSFNDAVQSDSDFTKMYQMFYQNQDALTARGLMQQQDARWLIHNPPQPALSGKEMDAIHDLDFSRDVHPYYSKQGRVAAQETIRFSIPALRGCYGECSFCAIAVHQGRQVVWRSEKSILAEARKFTRHPSFKGIISDVGGPSANMYGFECEKKVNKGACRDKRCLYPDVCSEMKINHNPQISLLAKLRKIAGVKKVFLASGIRHDMILKDSNSGRRYLTELLKNHISGQMKIAPEHTSRTVLQLMGKPGREVLIRFKKMFDEISGSLPRRQFLTYYFIAAHPGCSEAEMRQLKYFTDKELHIAPEQVQIYTPLPSTWAAVAYYTKKDPFTGKGIFVEKRKENKERQKRIITRKG